MHFPASGVDCPIWVPPTVAFVIALVTAPAGLSGAFMILPLQMSVLGFTAPGVTPTNLLYNVIAIPGGVYRYIREGRMNWPLAWIIVAGTLPGIVMGAVVRVRYLVAPGRVKLFVGLVLAYIAIRLFRDLRRKTGDLAVHGAVRSTTVSLRQIEYAFAGKRFAYRPAPLFLLAVAVGVVGGIYGVGGGAIIAPYIIAILNLPAYTIAGAAMLATFLTSLAGVGVFELLGRTPLAGGAAVRPDWLLGVLFGAGGLFGSYCGARLQKRLPERWIKLFLGIVIGGLAAQYVAQFFV